MDLRLSGRTVAAGGGIGLHVVGTRVAEGVTVLGADLEIGRAPRESG
ncbi:hypothetical protein ABZ260_22355 [Streptosporangium sp. NPDC006013]